MNALVTERLPGEHPAHARPAEDARGRRQRRHRHERRRGLRAPARPAGRAAPPRGVSTTPPERPRGFLINTWIASELVDALLDRRLAEEGVHSRLLRDAERDRRLGTADAEQGRRADGHAADDGLRPAAAHGRGRRRRARRASRRRPVASRPADGAGRRALEAGLAGAPADDRRGHREPRPAAWTKSSARSRT